MPCESLPRSRKPPAKHAREPPQKNGKPVRKKRNSRRREMQRARAARQRKQAISGKAQPVKRDAAKRKRRSRRREKQRTRAGTKRMPPACLSSPPATVPFFTCARSVFRTCRYALRPRTLCFPTVLVKPARSLAFARRSAPANRPTSLIMRPRIHIPPPAPAEKPPGTA